MAVAPSRLPVRPTADPKPPRGLSAPARRFWRSVVKTWEMSASDLAVLDHACKCMDVIAASEAALAANGSDYTDGRFGLRPHPGAVIRDRNRVILARLLAQLGLAAEEMPAPKWHR